MQPTTSLLHKLDPRGRSNENPHEGMTTKCHSQMNTDFEVGSEGGRAKQQARMLRDYRVSLSLTHLLTEGLTGFLQLVKIDSELLSPPAAGITGR